jgi:histidine triad (HIT) family protein
MSHVSDCVFCQIVADVTKCTLLVNEPKAMAFMDINPANPGHCLVIPKRHWPTVFDIPPDEFATVARLAVQIAAGVEAALRPPGLSLVQANGPAANQTVPHLHVHVLPRYENDGLLLNWLRTGGGDSAQIVDVAARIRMHIPFA